MVGVVVIVGVTVLVGVGVLVGVDVAVGFGLTLGLTVGVGVSVGVIVGVGVGVGVSKQFGHPELNCSISSTFVFGDTSNSSLTYVKHLNTPSIDANIHVPIVAFTPSKINSFTVYNSSPVLQSSKTFTEPQVKNSSKTTNET